MREHPGNVITEMVSKLARIMALVQMPFWHKLIPEEMSSMETHTVILEPGHVDAALLLLRIASSSPFLYHGSAILCGWFGGLGAAPFAASHHWPVAVGYLVGLAEMGGAAAIASGILFRVGAASIASVMVGAIFLVHLRNGFDVSNGGVEYALTQLLIVGALLFTGPGRYSLAFLMPRSLRRF
jgi:putative oxidoreductase